MAKIVDLTYKNRDHMTLRSASSRKDSQEVPVDPNSAMSKALTNPLVLDLIFGNLGLPDLKTSRLVCREWNDVGATFLGKRALLQVNKLFSYEGSEPAKMTTVNEKLIRRLLISEKFDSSIPTNKKTEVMIRALTHVEKVSELTSEIKFLVTQKEFISAFLEGIRLLGSTKIEHVGIFRFWRGHSVNTIPAQEYQKLPPQSSLTSLKFEALSDFQHDGNEFRPLIQIWLDCAPNLTSLDIATTFYPNLDGCTSLKVLKFKLVKCYNEHYRHLNVTMMLSQVKNSLIKLELDHSMHNYVASEQIQTAEEVPVMSELTSLAIHAVDVYKIGIGFEAEYNIFFFTCDITTTVLDWMPLWTSAAINRFMKPFEMWDLERVNVSVEVKESALLIDALQAISVLKGVKKVQFGVPYIHNTMDNIFDIFQDVILHIGSFKSVGITINELAPEIVERLQLIGEASGAPIHFIGRSE
ncbi:Lysosomal alpha-glucosidase [Folsomia candida]|uniref:Lysosomal alpha-glucosidase n=1 Tax=Folsomia candida TaxID=158441 RepID=A0A226DFV9_FOLCA|nr:Lysosomal alpha-glucosidase [Folsomia candida]